MIKKIINQIKSVSLIGVVAITLASGVAVAEAKANANAAATLYGYDQTSGLWVTPRSTSHCNSDPSQNCEAQWNGDPNNGGIIVPATLVYGDFVY